jgi:hypothetical protein
VPVKRRDPIFRLFLIVVGENIVRRVGQKETISCCKLVALLVAEIDPTISMHHRPELKCRLCRESI